MICTMFYEVTVGGKLCYKYRHPQTPITSFSAVAEYLYRFGVGDFDTRDNNAYSLWK